MRDVIARVWFGVVAAIAIWGVTLSASIWIMTDPAALVAHGGGHGNPADFDNWFVRLTITFFYFTILSNIVVGVTSLLLAIRLDRTSTVFRVFRLFGLFSIIITGLVVNFYLGKFVHLEGIDLINNDMVHVAVPILATLGWLIFGPRTPFRFKYLFYALGIGLVWLLVTFIHGALLHWYPYPFLDVDTIGYPKALTISLAILAFAFLLGMAILGLDKVLPGHDKLLEESEQPTA
ncbi:MAG: Pr6Pr family membrane protein [Candidatus Nanopelagicales bacterium]|nr:Pr6Pr family membrane protein [Candidatus Nanopelagicales bacterium]